MPWKQDDDVFIRQYKFWDQSSTLIQHSNKSHKSHMQMPNDLLNSFHPVFFTPSHLQDCWRWRGKMWPTRFDYVLIGITHTRTQCCMHTLISFYTRFPFPPHNFYTLNSNLAFNSKTKRNTTGTNKACLMTYGFSGDRFCGACIYATYVSFFCTHPYAKLVVPFRNEYIYFFFLCRHTRIFSCGIFSASFYTFEHIQMYKKRLKSRLE